MKPRLSPLSSLYYLFSPFLHPVSAPRYAFTVLNLPFFCASMILDDCLMTITPASSLSASDVDLSQPLPTYKSSFTNSFAVHFFLPCCLESRSSISSSSLLVASSVCSLIYSSCSSSQSEVAYPALGIVTPHSHTALLSIIMSLYYLNEFHACLPSFCTSA